MPTHPRDSRRAFLKKVAATSALSGSLAPMLQGAVAETLRMPDHSRISPNDTVRIATIGMGIIGFIDTDTALQVPGVELVAAADLYEGRRIHVKEVYGNHIDTYVDYREILARTDVDAVLICTPDHWHVPIAKDALRAGKAVYCEKPMVHQVEEGLGLIQVQKETGKVFQVGSQYASSILYAKAHELYKEGAIGTLNMIEAITNRNSATGAWQYSIPTDASEETVDWDRFLGSAPKRPFDAKRFFRWRNYWDYGTATAGDLYVHLFTGIHRTLDAIGPTDIVAQGGLRFWKDGRDVPDVLLSLFAYPETEMHPAFNMSLQTNFVDGQGGGFHFKFIGDEGVITVGGSSVTVERNARAKESISNLMTGYNSARTFSNAQQKLLEAELRKNYVEPVGPPLNSEMTFNAPRGYDDRFDHFTYFFDSIRNGRPVFEDATFGFRAAAPTLLANMSYVNHKPYVWDPKAMKITG
ncbi:MAG: Gfo/Idh/MocA family oxidoreductase [Rhodothermales bacterium]